MSTTTKKSFDDDEQEQSTASRVPSYHTNDETVPSNKKNDTIKQEIAKEESKAVHRVRWIVLTVLVTAGMVVCFLVYFLSRNSVNDQYKVQFEGQAGQIQLMFQRIATEKFGAFGALRVAVMAEAIDKKDQWPMFTMSSFEKRATVARRLSQFMLMAIHPWVDRNNRIAFEEYCAQVGPTMV
jgi:hypothetical protein